MTTDDDLPDPGEIRDEEIPGLLRSLALVGCRHSTMTATVINCLRLAADELERLRAEVARLDALQSRRWDVRDEGGNSYIYVGPTGIKGKPWGVGRTVREAIDDAIRATAGKEGDAS